MKPAIFTIGFLFIAIAAQADVINVKLGQNAALEAGDVAIIGNGKMNSAITCNGQPAQPEPQQPQLPPTQLFEARGFGRFPQPQQDTAAKIGRDLALGYLCGKDSIIPEIRQAQDGAVIHARQACFDAGYSNCAQPYNINEQFQFRIVGDKSGEYGCAIIARMVGTQPN